MSRFTVRTILAGLGAAALLLPSAGIAKPVDQTAKRKGPERSAKAKGKTKVKAKKQRKSESRSQTRRAAAKRAKGKGMTEAKNAVFHGYVGSVDLQAGTVEVEVEAGNRWARPFVGETVVFEVFDADLVIEEDFNRDGRHDLEDIEGGAVSVHARIVRGSFDQPFSAHRFIAFSEDEADYGDEPEFDPEHEEVEEDLADDGVEDEDEDEDESLDP